MEHHIDMKAVCAEIGITNPSKQLLDTAMAEARRLNVVMPAVIAAINIEYGTTEKRRTYTPRKSKPQPEITNES